ncbi:MAG: TonB-dependent receptor, partial [Hyphomicrobium sp.]
IREATITTGSYNRARTTIDVGDKISPDAAFRLNTMYEYSESFRDYFDLQRYGLNPTLAFRPNDNTKISLSYEYFKDDRVVDRGVPSFIGTPGRPSNGPIENFFGNPNVSQSDFDGQSATATLEHRTESGVNIRNHTFLATYDKIYSNTFANSPVIFPGSCGDLSGCVTLGGYKNGTQRDTAVNQTDITYLWDMGNGIRHTFLGGAEFSYQETDNYRNNASFGLPGTLSYVVPFDHPTTFVPVFYDQFQRDWNTEVSTYSAYIQDQLEITKYFELIGGIRYERFDVAFDGRTAGVNGGNPQSISRIDNVFPYRVGAVFKPIETTSFYITTADSFLPGAGDQFGNLTVINGQTLEPEEFKNKEFGFKWEVAPRLLFTGALYQLDRSNQIVPTSPTTSAQLGLTRTRGGELALTGYITDQWQVSAGWGHQIATIIESGTNPFEGNNVPFVPHNLVSMWNRYQFLSWFGSGLGIIYQDSSFAEPNNAVELPAFTRVDAALYFDFNENWRAQVNVENILDEKYYASAHNNNNISPGAPRQAFVTLRAKF